MPVPTGGNSGRNAAQELSELERKIHMGLRLVSLVRMCETADDHLLQDLSVAAVLYFVNRTEELKRWYARLDVVITNLRRHYNQCSKDFHATVQNVPKTHAWMLACKWAHFEPQGEPEHDGHSVASLFIRRILRRPVNNDWFPQFDWTPEQTVRLPTYLHQE